MSRMSWTHHRQALRLPSRPLLIGHRGWGGRYPENTLPSLLAARDFGVDAIEIDLMPTRDGEIVLSHEPLLHHQSNGHGPIAQHTLGELQRLDAGYRFSPDGQHFPYRGAGIRLLSLPEALDALPHTRLYLDLKSDEPRFIHSVLAAINRFGLQSRAILCSFYPNAIREVRRLQPHLATAADRSEVTRLFTASLLRLHRWVSPRVSCAIHVPERRHGIQVLNERLRDLARSLDLGLIVWTVNCPHDAERLLDFGIDGLMTDHPDRIAPVFARRALLPPPPLSIP